MNPPPDEMAAKIGPTGRQSAAGSDDSSKEQLRAAFKEFERTSQQSGPVEDDKLDQRLHGTRRFTTGGPSAEPCG